MCLIVTWWKPRGVRPLGLALPFALATALPGVQQAVPKHLPVFPVRDMCWDSGAKITKKEVYGGERTGGLGARQQSWEAIFASKQRLCPYRGTRTNWSTPRAPMYMDRQPFKPHKTKSKRCETLASRLCRTCARAIPGPISSSSTTRTRYAAHPGVAAALSWQER